MGNMAQRIMEEIQTHTVFTVAGIGVSEGVVVTWIVMAVLVLLAVALTRNLRTTNISRRQAAVEVFVTKIEGLVGTMIGEEGSAYGQYLATILLFITVANISGIFGVKPPTKDLNVAVALALTSIVAVQVASIRKRRLGGWLRSFTKPVAIVTPFNILDLVTRPLSLCLRLFGNVLGAFIIMKLLEAMVPVGLPAVFSLYFDFFDGILQAYVFVFLTSVYMREAIE